MVTKRGIITTSMKNKYKSISLQKYLRRLLKNGWQFVVMKKVDHRMLDEEPRGDESESRMLPVEAVMVGVESKVVEEEESQPMALGGGRVTTYRVVLI